MTGDEEIAAQMRHLAAFGWPAAAPKLDPEECRTVTEFVIEQSRKVSRPLEFRLLFDKAYPDYLQHRGGEAETDWRDLVLSTLAERTEEPRHAPANTRQHRKRAEQRLAARLRHEHAGNVQEQLRLWKKETGRSVRAFWRRLADAGGDARNEQ